MHFQSPDFAGIYFNKFTENAPDFNKPIMSVRVHPLTFWNIQRILSYSSYKFFKSAIDVVGHSPVQITTDKNPTYPGAIKQALGNKVKHRTNKYLNKLFGARLSSD